MVEDRIAALESRAASLEARVREMEHARRGTIWDPAHPEAPAAAERSDPHGAAPAPREAPRPSWAQPDRVGSTAPPATPVTPAAISRADSRPARDLEDLVGGRVLAWVGGVAVLAGLAF